jgi:hypothetical protein
MKQINNFGILAAISWNSNKWEDEPTTKDLSHSKFEYVEENWHEHESLNFGHEKFPCEEDGTYIGYTPMFNRLPSYEGCKNVKVVFFKSNDWKTNTNYIVGMYAFPEIDEVFNREAEDPMFEDYDWGNVKSKKDNIVRFENYLPIKNETLHIDRFLPLDKKIGQQGFNYLHSDNVLRILDGARKLNPTQGDLLFVSSRLKKIILF